MYMYMHVGKRILTIKHFTIGMRTATVVQRKYFIVSSKWRSHNAVALFLNFESLSAAKYVLIT